MSDAGSETFALAQHGFGRSGPPRALAQWLALFSPQQAHGFSPLLVARANGLAQGELDLAALLPHVVEEGAVASASGVPRPAAVALPFEAPALAQAQPDVPAAAMPAPLSQPHPAVTAIPLPESAAASGLAMAAPMSISLAAPAEVFALHGASMLKPEVALAADGPALMGAVLRGDIPAPSAVVTDEAAPLPINGAFAVIEPALPTPAFEHLPQAATKLEPSPTHIPSAPHDDEAPAAFARPPAPLPEAAPLRQVLVPDTAPVPPAPMGFPIPAADPYRGEPQVPPHRVLERLAEATRKLDDEAVVRIGSVSVVMRPTAPTPLPEQMAPLAPPLATPLRSAHRNPWLSRGQGID